MTDSLHTLTALFVPGLIITSRRGFPSSVNITCQSSFRPSPNNYQILTRCCRCLQWQQLWNPLTANALRTKAVTWSFALTVLLISSAIRCASVYLLAALLYLTFGLFIEHQCRWVVQQNYENRGFESTHYNSGIGTYTKPSWKSVKYKIDLAIAWWELSYLEYIRRLLITLA